MSKCRSDELSILDSSLVDELSRVSTLLERSRASELLYSAHVLLRETEPCIRMPCLQVFIPGSSYSTPIDLCEQDHPIQRQIPIEIPRYISKEIPIEIPRYISKEIPKEIPIEIPQYKSTYKSNYKSNHRSNHRSNRIRLTPNRRWMVLMKQELKCKICHAKVPDDLFDIDHILPISLGGTNHISNLQAIHKHCHALKSRIEEEMRIDLWREKRTRESRFFDTQSQFFYCPTPLPDIGSFTERYLTRRSFNWRRRFAIRRSTRALLFIHAERRL